MATLASPNVKHPVTWMTPEWKSAFRHAADEADRLHLDWVDETAGPWMKPSEAMKKVVWSETCITAGTHFHGTLAHPPSVNGYCQGIGGVGDPTIPLKGGTPGLGYADYSAENKPDPTFYANT